jgi:hypothetical protein
MRQKGHFGALPPRDGLPEPALSYFPLFDKRPYQFRQNMIFDRLASKRYPLTGRKGF